MYTLYHIYTHNSIEPALTHCSIFFRLPSPNTTPSWTWSSFLSPSSGKILYAHQGNFFWSHILLHSLYGLMMYNCMYYLSTRALHYCFLLRLRISFKKLLTFWKTLILIPQARNSELHPSVSLLFYIFAPVIIPKQIAYISVCLLCGAMQFLRMKTE